MKRTKNYCKNCGKLLVGEYQLVVCSQLCVSQYGASLQKVREARRQNARKLWDNPEYRKKRIAEYHARKGPANPNWKGGPKEAHNCKQWQNVSRLVRERDAETCQDCGKKTGRMDVHHINFDSSDHRVENGITLCNKCHAIRHDVSGRVTEYWKHKRKEIHALS